MGSKERRVEKLSIVLVCTVHACRCMYFSRLLNSKSFAQIVTIFIRTLFIKGSKLKDWISSYFSALPNPGVLSVLKKMLMSSSLYSRSLLKILCNKNKPFLFPQADHYFPFFLNRYVWYIFVWLSL